jgi:hypothetical protein
LSSTSRPPIAGIRQNEIPSAATSCDLISPMR